jgi:hypothetical protein
MYSLTGVSQLKFKEATVVISFKAIAYRYLLNRDFDDTPIRFIKGTSPIKQKGKGRPPRTHAKQNLVSDD